MGRAFTPSRPATYRDLQGLPENQTGEIVGGELFVTPRPAFGHAEAESALALELKGPFDRGRGGPGGWLILAEPEVHLTDDVVVPTSRGLAPRPTDWTSGSFDGLLHPGPRLGLRDPLALDRCTRPHPQDGGLCAGARGHAWLVDPLAYSLEVFRLDPPAWKRVGAFEGPAKVRAEPFEAIELDLSTLWVPRAPTSDA